jgi:hypothetical protein
MNATIVELGNGLPTAGDYVPSSDGNLYRVVSIDGQIQTGRSAGAGNWVLATVELADWGDCDEEDEFPASVRVEAE